MYAQTRTGSITCNGDSFGEELDKEVVDVVKTLHDSLKTAAQRRNGEDDRRPTGKPKDTSCVLHSAHAC